MVNCFCASPNIVLRLWLWLGISRPFAVFVSELVGVSTTWLVGTHFLAISRPMNLVTLTKRWLKPLVEVTGPTVREQPWQELATARSQLDKEAWLGFIYDWKNSRSAIRGCDDSSCVSRSVNMMYFRSSSTTMLPCGYLMPLLFPSAPHKTFTQQMNVL